VPQFKRKFFASHKLLSLLSVAACWAASVALRAGSLPAGVVGLPPVPTPAQVQREFAAAHGQPPALARFLCEHEAIYFALGATQNLLCALDDGDASVALLVGSKTYDLRLEQTNPTGSNYKFTAYAGSRVVGAFMYEMDYADSVCYLMVGRKLNPALANFQQSKFWLLAAPGFASAARHELATPTREAAPGYHAAQTLNDKGYFLQQLGRAREANMFFDEVLRRYPSRAVAYLNRGDAHWTLSHPAKAQADYRHYLALLRTQHKDTTRVPAYMRLALRLPTGS
jgi:tetratricopeptide (TPR) repeat protein